MIPSTNPYPSTNSEENRDLGFLLAMVLYGMRLEEAETFQTLSCCDKPNDVGPVPLAIWDNSAESLEPMVSGPFHLVSWHHDPSNPGLVKAYNAAAATAREAGYQWLLLLDQDSRLPPDFLTKAEAAIRVAAKNTVALVPTVASDGIHRSPVRAIFDFPVNFLHAKDSGPSRKPIYAINSGMLVRTDFLNQIGGYSDQFWLDAVDHWFCREVYRRGKQIGIFDSQIEHSISVNETDKPLSLSRYDSILESQSTFVITSGRWSTKLFYAGLLTAHGFRKLIQKRGRKYAAIAFGHWKRFVRSALTAPKS